MNHTIVGLEQTEEELLNFEVSDEALEAAGTANVKVGNPTAPFAIICIPFAD